MPRARNVWWLPLMVWLLLVVVGTGVLVWQQDNGRRAVAHRFDTGVVALGSYLGSIVTEQLERERAQALASLADPVVNAQGFDRVVAGFGFPSAVLLDSRGRVIQTFPADPAAIGQDQAARYEHLRDALQGRPVVSRVFTDPALGAPVAAFAVPYETTSGRRVFSGSLPIRASPLAAYFSSTLSLTGARVQLVDSGGAIVAATDTFDVDKPTLAAQDGPLAAALSRGPGGRLESGGSWRRFSSTAVDGAPWRLSASVAEDTLFASLNDNEIAGRAALAGAAVVGLAVVVAAGRARASRRELLLSERRFRKVFDGSRIGMVLADTQGRSLWVNPAACQIFGRTEQEVVGRLTEDFAHPDDAGLAAGPMQDCIEGHLDGFDLDKRYVQPDGRLVEASITSSVLRDEADRPHYFATQIIDTTERRGLERERERNRVDLARHAEELLDANTHLADVMAMLSHDVRQPLSKIVGLGGLLEEEWPAIPEATKINYVKRMTAAGLRANDLVTDILMLAQLDAGAMLARPVRTDIAHAVREAVTAHHDHLGSPITVIAPDQTTGLADPGQLQLILGNLLTNAVKYGRPPIEVTVVNAGEQVAIRVADHGEGVPPEFAPHLFDRFARADSGVAATTPGTGLGLYLVQQLAQAGGLTVTYEPNQPHGAVFLLSVPRAAPGARLRAPDPTLLTPGPI